MLYWQDKSATIYHGDSLDVLKGLPDNSVDSICCDPPSGTGFMAKAWDKDKGGYNEWITWLAGIFREARRVLKPGGHIFAWALPRTSHWTGMALEISGFEIRDSFHHIFGSGFPKSRNISKDIDNRLGAKRKVIGTQRLTGNAGTPVSVKGGTYTAGVCINNTGAEIDLTEPATEEAKKWEGFGSASKPSHEVWWMARNPLSESSIAANVLKWGTGAINIDGCRVGSAGGPTGRGGTMGESGWLQSRTNEPIDAGRWPPNTLFSHSSECTEDECVDLCPVDELDKQSGLGISRHSTPTIPDGGRSTNFAMSTSGTTHNDSGGASRFFHCFRYEPKPNSKEKNEGLEDMPLRASQKLNSGGIQGRREAKAQAAIDSQQGLDGRGRTLIREDGTKTLVDRFIPSYNANRHPTVKGLALMRWLVRLVTPKDGTTLDCFMGSGTTGCAAMYEGFKFVGIDMSEEYCEISKARIKHHADKAVNGSRTKTVDSDGNVTEQMGLFG